MRSRRVCPRCVLLGVILLSAHSLRADDASGRLLALDRAIMLRTASDGKVYGRNEVDPLIWSESKYFLAGDSRTRLVAALENVEKLPDAELRRCPPAQRALAQNRVWAVFDFVTLHAGMRSGADRAYLLTLAKVMAKLALGPEEIAAISDPLAAAATSGKWPAEPGGNSGPDNFLPAGIAAADGGWVTLALERGGEPSAKLHAAQFGGRTWFLLRAHFPSGAPGPEDYFKQVADVPIAWIPNGNGTLRLNPALPVMPRDAEFVLERKLAVIDRDGHWQATAMTLTVQVRQYRVTDQAAWKKLLDTQPADGWKKLQSFSELRLKTDAIAAGLTAEMEMIQPDEKGFMFFFAFGFDQVDGTGGFPGFKPGPMDTPMHSCAMCHPGLGLGSINALVFSQPVQLPRLIVAPEDREAEATRYWKMERAEWGALQLLWPAAEGTVSTH